METLFRVFKLSTVIDLLKICSFFNVIFCSRELRRIFGPQKEEVAGGWRRLHNEELRNLYASLNVATVIK